MHVMLIVGDLGAHCQTSGRLSAGTHSSCSRVACMVHKVNRVHNSVVVPKSAPALSSACL